MLKPTIKQPPPPEYCDLLQAVQWLAYGWEPVPYEFMDILGRGITIDDSEVVNEAKKALLLLFKTGGLKPVGLRLDVEKPLSAGAQKPVLKRIAAMNLDLYEKSIKGFENIPLEFWRAKEVNWENSWCWEFNFHDEVKEVPVYLPCPPPLGRASTDAPKTQFKNVRTAYLKTVYTEIHIPTKEILNALSDDSQQDFDIADSAFSNELNKDEGSPEKPGKFPRDAGRPTVKAYYVGEFRQRAENNLLKYTLAAECRYLMKWTQARFDGAPRTLKAYENAIRREYNVAKNNLT